MCIRDRRSQPAHGRCLRHQQGRDRLLRADRAGARTGASTCLLYTSDAADERSSVDLGGRRIIKKKKQQQHV